MFQDFVNVLGRLFTRSCKTCIAKDYFIATLKEQLREEKSRVNDLLSNVTEVERHLLRMEKDNSSDKSPFTNQVTVPIRRNSLGNRIKAAEKASQLEASEQGLPDKRIREYNERVEALMKEPDVKATN